MCFLQVDLRGAARKQKPATQTCHRLRNQPGLSARGTHPAAPRPAASGRARAALCPAPPPRGRAPPPLLLPLPPSPSRARPGPAASLPAARALWGSALGALPPQPRGPSSEKLIVELAGRAGVDGAGGRRWARPPPALLSPAPSDSPTGSSLSGRELLARPPSLSRSLAPSRLPGRTPGWYRTGGLLVRCAAGVNGIKEKGKHTNKKIK